MECGLQKQRPTCTFPSGVELGRSCTENCTLPWVMNRDLPTLVPDGGPTS